MAILSGKTFVLELGRDIRFKAKQELINYLREQNAQISYILTASTDYVLVSSDVDTYKTRRAKQLGIQIVNVEYIYECRNCPTDKEAIDIKRFFVTSAEDQDNFSKSGTIPIAGGCSSGPIKPAKVDLSKIKIWNADDVELPHFDELTHAEIGKWAIFKETNDHSDVYFALELQIIPEEYENSANNRYRFRYEKQTITSSKGKLTVIQYAFSTDIHELHQLFASYYSRIGTMPRITRIRDLLPDKLGSKLLFRSLFLHRFDTQMLDDNVCQLIESLWIESIGDLDQILAVPPASIVLQTILEAEAALLEIKSNGESASKAEARFYTLIPHRSLFVVDLIKDRRALIDKIDLCQMLRDMATVNELTNWNVKASIEAKYRALKCHIETVDKDTQEYKTLTETISSSKNQNEQMIIHQIYSVAKQTDALRFRSTLFNQKQLFHGSKYNHFLGILSRGLLMPKMVVDDLGVTRTDIGCLGYGIYFSDSISTSLKYTTSSTTRPGRRLLCISQVALGNSAKFYSYAPNLTESPENFHSTHGVKKTSENNSKFVDDEFVIYNLDQQRLLYIVEVSWMPHDHINQPAKLLPIIRDTFIDRTIDQVAIPSVMDDEIIQVAEQDYGLICPSSGQLVPLKAFHVRVQIVDITAEVVLYQVYHNTNSTPIEAKYVFPLDDNCSVCGFEAHINNKIIKGVVKEKEQAKREYREAIEKGHGAYLMHQEQPEVFSVSVGNLPANCEVIIKITYVAELPIENNDIIFRLPAKVASWQSKQALESKDQTIVPSINLQQDNSSMKSVEFSLKGSIRMPYEIIRLFSPTHRLRRKLTDCTGMIEIIDNVLLEKDFILSLTLKSVHLPRMLNETFARTDENNNEELIDETSQASMLTFYPRFEMTNPSNEYVEIVFIIDVSNSMDGKHVQQAKQLAHLFLTNMKIEETNFYFNIVTFGSDNDECFPISSLNTQENLDKAKHFILHSLDHRGNTDLFTVLRQYSLLPSLSKLGRQFLLLSDGHINDLKPILSLLENQTSMRHDRLFTCSIGDTANKHHLKQLANSAPAGGLSLIFDSNYRSRWKSKVLNLLEHIRQPCVTNIQVDWHGTIEQQQQEVFTGQAPKIIRSLFNGMRLTVYRFIQNCHKATLTAKMNDQEFVTTIFSNKMTETKGRILHCLTARAIIQDYENGFLHTDETESELIKTQFKQDLIELSVKYSVVSSLTSFVAIEERDGKALEPGVRLLDVMLERDTDILPYIGWDGDRTQIEIIKDKLINGKRALIGASVSNSIQLAPELELLCQQISYRSGGEAKYDLILALIDTYRSRCKLEENARTLERQMQTDLIEEIKNAKAEERQILETRLNEINHRIHDQHLEQSENQTPMATIYKCSLSSHLDTELQEPIDSTESDSWASRSSATSTDDDDDAVYCQMFSERKTKKMPETKHRAEGSKRAVTSIVHSDDEDGWGGGDCDMGFSLFDDNIGEALEECVVSKSTVVNSSSSISDTKLTERECKEADHLDTDESLFSTNVFAELSPISLKAIKTPTTTSTTKNLIMDGVRSVTGKSDGWASNQKLANYFLKQELIQKRLALGAFRRSAATKTSRFNSKSIADRWDETSTEQETSQTVQSQPMQPTTQITTSSHSEWRKSSPAKTFGGKDHQRSSNIQHDDLLTFDNDTDEKDDTINFGPATSLTQRMPSLMPVSNDRSDCYMFGGLQTLTAETSAAAIPSPATSLFSFGSNSNNNNTSIFIPTADVRQQAVPSIQEQEFVYQSEHAVPLYPAFGGGFGTIDIISNMSSAFGFSKASSIPPPLPATGGSQSVCTTSANIPPPPPLHSSASTFDPFESDVNTPFSSPYIQPSLMNQPAYNAPPPPPPPPPPPLPPTLLPPTPSAFPMQHYSRSIFQSPTPHSTSSPIAFGFGASSTTSMALLPTPTSSSRRFVSRGLSVVPMASAPSFAASSPVVGFGASSTMPLAPTAPFTSSPPVFGFDTTYATPMVPTSSSTSSPPVFSFGAPPVMPLAPPLTSTSSSSLFVSRGLSVVPMASPPSFSASAPVFGFGASSTMPLAPTAPFTSSPPVFGFGAPPAMPLAPPLTSTSSSSLFGSGGFSSAHVTSTSSSISSPPVFGFGAPSAPPPLPASYTSSSSGLGFGAFRPTTEASTSSTKIIPTSLSGSISSPVSSDARIRDKEKVTPSQSMGVSFGDEPAALQLNRSKNEEKSAATHSYGRLGRSSTIEEYLSDKITYSGMVELSSDAFRDDSMSLSLDELQCDEVGGRLIEGQASVRIENDDDEFVQSVRMKKKSKKLSKMSSSAATENNRGLQDLLLLDVTPVSLGIEDIHGHMYTIIERNRTIPLKTSFYSVFTNAYAYQTTATIRVFSGQHKLTKYNTFIGELTLTGLTQNFASQTLQIAICMDIDANGIIHVAAQETRSGAKASIKIDPNTYAITQHELEHHIKYVESNPDYRASSVTDRQANDSLLMLAGQTENAAINFTGESTVSTGCSSSMKLQIIYLTSTMIEKLMRIQLVDGSFTLTDNLAKLLSIDPEKFEQLKSYLKQQGFHSFALNTQEEILRLIATGIFLIEMLFQVPTSDRQICLFPFDAERIRAIFQRHLPKALATNLDKAMNFYEEKRRRHGIYCEQLELNYSSWEKFIQHGIFHMAN